MKLDNRMTYCVSGFVLNFWPIYHQGWLVTKNVEYSILRKDSCFMSKSFSYNLELGDKRMK